MSEELFSLDERTSLDGFPPDIDVAAFWMSDEELSGVVGWRHSEPARFAAGLQLGALRALGFVPDDLSTAPPEVIEVVAEQTGLSPSVLVDYRPPDRTRRNHVVAVERALGFRRCDRGDLKAAGDWLVLRAMEHDRPITLFGLLGDHLRAERLVRPALSTMERLIARARQVAYEETWTKLRPTLSHQQMVQLDELLKFDPFLGATPLVWLCQQATAPIPEMVREQVVKLERLRQIGIATAHQNRFNAPLPARRPAPATYPPSTEQRRITPRTAAPAVLRQPRTTHPPSQRRPRRPSPMPDAAHQRRDRLEYHLPQRITPTSRTRTKCCRAHGAINQPAHSPLRAIRLHQPTATTTRNPTTPPPSAVTNPQN